MLAGRRIVLCVTGGIAAYKAAYLARRLGERGAEVRAAMTPSAAEFLGPQTLAAITGRPPVTDLFGDAESVSPHTDLAHWADLVVVAPATAATIARIANGLSEDAVSATVLATRSQVVVAPAMHTEMWVHPATQENVTKLRSFGYVIVEPESGELAGGDEGVGRLADPDVVAAVVEDLLGGGDLDGWQVLVSAGGTREPIDPVRYLGNRSTGKMGNAVALAAARRGANVTLVTTQPGVEHPSVEVIEVATADEMAASVWKLAPEADVAVLAAAVADFRPAEPATRKVRRTEGLEKIELEPTPDILAGVAALESRPYLVGFAAETGSIDVAIEKAKSKGVDLLVANDVTSAGSGFGTDTNEVTLISSSGSVDEWPLTTKAEVADRLWDAIRDRREGAPS